MVPGAVRRLAPALALFCLTLPSLSRADDPLPDAIVVPDSLVEAPGDSAGFEVLVDLLAPTLYRPVSFADSLRYLDSLRVVVHDRRADVEARRRLADLLAASRTVEGRREAAQALTEAILVVDDDVDLWLRLARLRHRQRFTAYSRNAYHKALELAANDPKVWDELAMLELLQFQRFQAWSDLYDAERVNHMVLGLAPTYPRALFRQIRIACYEDDDAQMDTLAARWRREDPRAAAPRLVQAMLLTGREDYEHAEREFTDAFALMDSARAGEYRSLEVADPVAAERLREDPDSARAVVDYWRRHDPTPTDDLNPRLLEHYRRMVLADLLFAVEDRALPGWAYGPGALLVRLGIPETWSYRSMVSTDTYRLSSTSSYAARSILVTYGRPEDGLTFRFVDFAMNGIYVRPQSTFSSADEFLAQEGTYYISPYPDPERDLEVAVWRFLDETGSGHLEVALALRESEWTEAVLREPERLLTRLAVYDSLWTRGEGVAADWGAFSRDTFGRLVGVWTLPAAGDSFMVGVETTDLDGTGRSAFFVPVPTYGLESTPRLSDIALLRDVRFPGDEGPYARLDGSAMPNPGGVYRSGEPIGMHFEAYALATEDGGDHDARIHVSLARRGRRGLIRVLLGSGGDGSQEMAFEDRAPGDRTHQLLSLDLPPLEGGDYLLQVELEDLTAGTKVTAEAPVRIIGAQDSLE